VGFWEGGRRCCVLLSAPVPLQRRAHTTAARRRGSFPASLRSGRPPLRAAAALGRAAAARPRHGEAETTPPRPRAAPTAGRQAHLVDAPQRRDIHRLPAHHARRADARGVLARAAARVAGRGRAGARARGQNQSTHACTPTTTPALPHLSVLTTWRDHSSPAAGAPAPKQRVHANTDTVNALLFTHPRSLPKREPPHLHPPPHLLMMASTSTWMGFWSVSRCTISNACDTMRTFGEGRGA
jgi:hypothetical protein